MTEQVQIADKAQEQAPAVRRYAIDSAWFHDTMRDFARLAESRMCVSCQSRLGTEVEQRVPKTSASGRVTFENRKVPYGNDAFAVIAGCCAQQAEYRSPRLPVMEIIFRLLLANRNAPLTLEAISQQVMEWVRPDDGRVINPSALERLILADDYYGVRPLEEAVPAQLAAAQA